MTKLLKDFIKTSQMCGIAHAAKFTGHFYVEKNKVFSHFAPKGVAMRAEETKNGVKAQIIVKKGAKIKEPLFFCFGLLGKKDEQFIIPNLKIEDGAEVKIIAHCSFPHAMASRHEMKADFIVGKNSKFAYEEHHYHGKHSGIMVYPVLNVVADENSVFESVFNLTKGTVGKVNIKVEALLKAGAKAYIETKVYGKNEKDEVSIVDKITLAGKNSKSLIKMRAAAKNGGKVFMQGETYASAQGATGHVDCQEIVIGKNSIARAVPIVEVTSGQARVTHEASVGKINQKELETLMTRGLNEDEATELIVESILR